MRDVIKLTSHVIEMRRKNLTVKRDPVYLLEEHDCDAVASTQRLILSARRKLHVNSTERQLRQQLATYECFYVSSAFVVPSSVGTKLISSHRIRFGAREFINDGIFKL